MTLDKVKMLKNYGLLLVSLVVTGILTGSCSDEHEMGTTVQPGTAIQFGVTDIKPLKRTVYEDFLKINWVKGDSIRICSTSENVAHNIVGNAKNAVYKIDNLDADGHQGHATIVTSESDQFLKWTGDLNAESTFYGAYPEARVKANPSLGNEVFCMEYHTSQVCKVVSSNDGKYQTAPDMKNAYMVAKNTLFPIGEHVLLAFDPIMTTPEITVTAGSYEVGTGIIQPVTVTGVSIIMPRGLKSTTLDYHISQVTNNISMAPHGKLDEDNDVGNGEQSIFVQIDNNGKKYIDLFEGESISLTAFLPPISNLTGAKIRVHTLGATDFVKSIEGKLQRQSKISIKLPNIKPDSEVSNNWISSLANQTLLKSMSIPAYVCEEKETPENLTTLLGKGVRAFKLSDEMLGGHLLGSKYILQNFCQSFNDFLDANPHEFLILWSTSNLKKGLSSENGYLKNWTSLPESPSTIESLRGHAVVLLQDNSWGKTYLWNLNNGKICDYGTVGDDLKSFLMMNDSWKVQANTNAGNNAGIYDIVLKYGGQTGCTGIVTIPNAGVMYDKMYGDLLLQAIIDCNFRFRSW